MTGEDGVLPGESVNVEAMVDNTVVGNELRSVSSDFTVNDDAQEPVTEKPEPEPESKEDAPKRRGVRRRKKEE